MDYSNISLVVPAYNNLQHLQNLYQSVRKYYTDVELVLMDDGSSDGTFEWLQEVVNQDDHLLVYKSGNRVGHTILYDKGIELSRGDIVGILHADMIVGPNYLENLLKHLDKGKVICATRIEPPLHPPGDEKIIQDFGMDFDTLDIDGFEDFTIQQQRTYEDSTTRGMFAPWLLYKEDFQRIGGHDPLFAPFPYEDSDIFQRWLLQGYELIQSRDSFVYHLTCRGHRWTEEIGKNDDYFITVEEKARRNYVRKWGSWIQNDKYQHPILIPVYNKGIEIQNSSYDLLIKLEPWFSKIKEDYGSAVYINNNQGKTSINLTDKFTDTLDTDIVVYIDGKKFTAQDMYYIERLNQIIDGSGSIGKFELGNMTVEIKKLEDKSKDLITL